MYNSFLFTSKIIYFTSFAKEILDPTGAYSNVSVFAEDGILYREETTQQFTFTFTNKNQIQDVIDAQVENIKKGWEDKPKPIIVETPSEVNGLNDMSIGNPQ